MKGVATVVLAAALLGALNYFLNPDRPVIIDRIVLDQIIPEKFLFVDARNENEYGQCHIGGAVNLSEQSFDSQIGAFLDLWDPAKKIAVYCNPGACNSSLKVAKQLKLDYGVENIFVVEGDWRKWKKQN